MGIFPSALSGGGGKISSGGEGEISRDVAAAAAEEMERDIQRIERASATGLAR